LTAPAVLLVVFLQITIKIIHIIHIRFLKSTAKTHSQNSFLHEICVNRNKKTIFCDFIVTTVTQVASNWEPIDCA